MCLGFARRRRISDGVVFIERTIPIIDVATITSGISGFARRDHLIIAMLAAGAIGDVQGQLGSR
jgi:hypothetical protein